MFVSNRSLVQPWRLMALHPHLFDTDKETINTSFRFVYRNSSHIYMINGKMSNMGRAFYSTHPESVNAGQAVASRAQLDIWDIYRSSLPVDRLSGGLSFIDLRFRKQAHYRSDIHAHLGNGGTGNIVHWYREWQKGRRSTWVQCIWFSLCLLRGLDIQIRLQKHRFKTR